MDEKQAARNRQKAAWDKANTKMIPVKLQNKTDADRIRRQGPAIPAPERRTDHEADIQA